MGRHTQPFARLLISTFLHLGTPGIYRRADGAEVATHFIAKTPDVVASFGDTRLVMASHRFDLLARDVPDPQEGERFILDGQTWQVVGEPLADRDRLIWTLTGAPV
jgi:hypothetical protein